MNYIIKSNYNGKTIKEFLRGEIRPSSRLLSLLKNRTDGITVNDKRVTVRYVLSEGDVLRLNYGDADGGHSVVPNASLLSLIKVIYEDDYIIAFDKPYGMPSHPSINHFGDTLANAAVAYFESKCQNINFRSANRLDKNTSGIVLMAKDKLTSAKLNNLIKAGEIKKVYTSVVAGDISLCAENIERINFGLQAVGGAFVYDGEKKAGKIIAPIKREKESIIKRVCDINGDYSETDFRILNISDDKKMSCLEVFPKTGRTHQIRVHLHCIGYPLIGDDLYFTGDFCEDNIIKRHALHASSLEFIHPVEGENIIISCDLSEDMKRLLESAFGGK